MFEARTLASGQRSEVWIHDTVTESNHLIYSNDELLLEAPNWHPDGQSLVLNGGGTLWRLTLEGTELAPIPVSNAPAFNNDHVLDPDGQHIYLSGMDYHLYRAPLWGGAASRVTADGAESGLLHFLHGVSPDGTRLAFIGVRVADDTMTSAEVYTIAADGSDYQQITSAGVPADGSEFSPDGEWIYFNTEAFGANAQLARVRADGSDLERLIVSSTVDWFPHLSPDGAQLAYLAYPSGTVGHPADLPVHLMLAPTASPQDARPAAALLGGQGTINVNSWSPDSTRFAYVAYPISSVART